jgi:4-oxalomesaconate tautomerase
MKQRSIPCLFFRGGTSKGPFFHASELPSDPGLRDRVLLAVMGSPDKRQIDGLGGAHSLTSKVGIVSASSLPGVDLDFLFVQLQPDTDVVDTTPNCGNMLAAVVPFAIETGLLSAIESHTTARVHTINTGMDCDVTVRTHDGSVDYDGSARIDGAPGRSAPIAINFLDTAGSVCSSMLPTGHVIDLIGGISVTCIDNGMPMVLLDAASVGRTGYETVEELNRDTELKGVLETLRLECGSAMGLGDVTTKNYPKMCLLSAPMAGGTISTRCFIPHVCHDAIGVLAAVTVATACVMDGSVAHALAEQTNHEQTNHEQTNHRSSQASGHETAHVVEIDVEHPSGEFSVELEVIVSTATKTTRVSRAALVRTARLLMRGEVMIPANVWPMETQEM